MPVAPELARQRQGDPQYEASRHYILGSSLGYTARPYFKERRRRRKEMEELVEEEEEEKWRRTRSHSTFRIRIRWSVKS